MLCYVLSLNLIITGMDQDIQNIAKLVIQVRIIDTKYFAFVISCLVKQSRILVLQKDMYCKDICIVKDAASKFIPTELM